MDQPIKYFGQLALFITALVMYGPHLAAQSNAANPKSTHTIHVKVHNCPFDSVSLRFPETAIKSVVRINPDGNTFTFTLDHQESDAWCVLTFLKGPQFDLIVKNDCWIDIDFNQPFTWLNTNPKVIDAPQTLELWQFHSLGNEYGKKRVEAKKANRESEVMRINQEDFEFKKRTILGTSSPSMAAISLISLKYFIKIVDYLEDKQSTLKLVASLLESKFPYSSMVQTEAKAIQGDRNDWLPTDKE